MHSRTTAAACSTVTGSTCPARSTTAGSSSTSPWASAMAACRRSSFSWARASAFEICFSDWPWYARAATSAFVSRARRFSQLVTVGDNEPGPGRPSGLARAGPSSEVAVRVGWVGLPSTRLPRSAGIFAASAGGWRVCSVFSTYFFTVGGSPTLLVAVCCVLLVVVRRELSQPSQEEEKTGPDLGLSGWAGAGSEPCPDPPGTVPPSATTAIGRCTPEGSHGIGPPPPVSTESGRYDFRLLPVPTFVAG